MLQFLMYADFDFVFVQPIAFVNGYQKFTYLLTYFT